MRTSAALRGKRRGRPTSLLGATPFASNPLGLEPQAACEWAAANPGRKLDVEGATTTRPRPDPGPYNSACNPPAGAPATAPAPADADLPAPAAAAAAAAPANDWSDEVVFYEGSGSNIELVLSILLSATLIYAPLTLASVGRRLWITIKVAVDAGRGGRLGGRFRGQRGRFCGRIWSQALRSIGTALNRHSNGWGSSHPLRSASIPGPAALRSVTAPLPTP